MLKSMFVNSNVDLINLLDEYEVVINLDGDDHKLTWGNIEYNKDTNIITVTDEDVEDSYSMVEDTAYNSILNNYNLAIVNIVNINLY